MIEFNASPEAYRLLIAQRGDLADKSGIVETFKRIWSDEVEKTIRQIGVEPKHALDIGSGLGLTDIELYRRFGTYCSLVDGEQYPTEFKHALPFCDRGVTEYFWAQNDVPTTAWRYLTPEQFRTEPLHGNFDLVISLRSWCFHYEPAEYLDIVQTHLAPQATLLIDVRRDRVDWLEALVNAFPGRRNQICIEVGEKYLRMKYKKGM